MNEELPKLSSPAPPTRLGPYRLLEQIGMGGMSRVYLAERDDEQFQQQVAIKLIDRGPEAIEIIRRFRTERQILAHLEHPHIARLLDGGETEDGRPYFVLEHIDGALIDVYCRRHRLSLQERLGLFLLVAGAVSYAHQNLIVHRDIKPSNILVTADGVPKLLDFGIAKILKASAKLSAVEVTVAGQAPMTPQYASPEQILGEPVTTATDVYGLGLLLYELLSEQRPYRLLGLSVFEVERLVCRREVSPPSAVVKPGALVRRVDLAGDLDAIVLKALAKEPGRRYATVQQMVEDLHLFLDGRPLAVARPLTLGYQLGKLFRRHALAAVASAALLVVLVGLLIALTVQGSRLAAERDEAQSARDRARDVSAFLAETFQRIDPSRGGTRSASAEEVLDLAAARLQQELSDQPLTRAELMTVIGRVYRNLTMYEAAKPLLEEALAIRLARLDESSPELAEAFYEVALIYQKTGEFDRSQNLLRRALSLRQKILGPDHPDTLKTMADSAFLSFHLGHPTVARSTLEEVIARYETQGPSRGLTESYIEIANIEEQLGAFSDAEKHYLKAIEALKEADPPAVQDLFAMQVNVAYIYLCTGRPREAERTLKENQSKHLELFGPTSLYTAVYLELMAEVHRAQGRYMSADQNISQGIEIMRKASGEDNPLLYPLRIVAFKVSLDLGHHSAASLHLEEARKICRDRLSEEHLCTGETTYLLARLQESSGEAEKTLQTYDEALALIFAFLKRNPGSSKVEEIHASILRAQARHLARHGKTEEAQEKQLHALEIVRGLLDTGSADGRDLYVKLLVDLGRVDEARPYAEELWQGGWRNPELTQIAQSVLGSETDQNLKSSSSRPP